MTLNPDISESEATQSCPTLCDPMACSLPGSSVPGIFQARGLEWVAISFSRGSSWPRDWTQVSHIAGRRFTIWATRKELNIYNPYILNPLKGSILLVCITPASLFKEMTNNSPVVLRCVKEACFLTWGPIQVHSCAQWCLSSLFWSGTNTVWFCSSWRVFLVFSLTLPALSCKLHRGRDLGPFCLLLCPQHWEQGLALIKT